jgi:ornithine cyclodeaminase
MPDPRFIGAEQVTEALDLTRAIDVLQDAFAEQSRGGAETMARAHLQHGPSILHAVGGRLGDIGGTKTWLYTPHGAAPLLILFSYADGRVLAVVEAFAFGQLRTAAVAGLATRLLARADARTFALLGTGRQALSQARAVASVRAIEEIRCFGRDPGHREALAARLEDELGVRVTQFADADEASAAADVITTITRAAEPVLHAAGVARGAHINAMGSIVPNRRELDTEAVGLADQIVVDSLEQASSDAGELLAAQRAGVLLGSSIRSLAEIAGAEATGTHTSGAEIAGAPRAARGAGEITLFKSLGVGLADVALGVELLRRTAPHPVSPTTTVT